MEGKKEEYESRVRRTYLFSYAWRTDPGNFPFMSAVPAGSSISPLLTYDPAGYARAMKGDMTCPVEPGSRRRL